MIDAEMIAQINALGRESRAHNQALAEQREILLRAAAQTLPEDVAVTVPLMYPAWDWQSCKRDMIVNYNGQLYRVLNTPTDNRPPDAEGCWPSTARLYRHTLGQWLTPSLGCMGWIARPGCITAMRINCGYASRIWPPAPGYRARLQRCGSRFPFNAPATSRNNIIKRRFFFELGIDFKNFDYGRPRSTRWPLPLLEAKYQASAAGWTADRRSGKGLCGYHQGGRSKI